MKKHILGLAIFSFIVFAAAFVYGIFSCSEQYPVYEVVSCFPETSRAEKPKMRTVNYEIPATFGKIDSNSPIIKQALLNKETKTLYLDLYQNNLDNLRYDAKLPLKFSFFRKDGKETKLITTEKYFLKSDYVRHNGTVIKDTISVSYDWLDTLDSYDNIYIIAEADSEYRNQKATSLFDSRFAKAITLFSGKTFSQR